MISLKHVYNFLQHNLFKKGTFTSKYNLWRKKMQQNVAYCVKYHRASLYNGKKGQCAFIQNDQNKFKILNDTFTSN